MKYPYEDYDTLKDLYDTSQAFANAVVGEFSADLDDVLYQASMHNTFVTFLGKLAKGIYRYYIRDRIAYEDKDVFLERLAYDLMENINYYFQDRNIDFLIGSNTDTGKYVLTSKVTSNSGETGRTGSSVVQSTATTPTGVNPTATGGTIDVKLDSTGTASKPETKMVISNDGYSDKYTNFQGKTNGVHQNKIDRDSTSTREGSYLQAIELLDRLPRSYFDKVLRDVSKHFVMVY